MRRTRSLAACALAIGAACTATASPLAAAASAAAATSPSTRTQAPAGAPVPISTVTLDQRGRPTFAPRAFKLHLEGENGCNVTLENRTPNTVVLTYGTPGMWKRLPSGAIAPGGAGGVGVGIAPYTAYFSAMGAADYVKVRCVP